MPEDEIFDDPNMSEMIMNPDLYGLEDNKIDIYFNNMNGDDEEENYAKKNK